VRTILDEIVLRPFRSELTMLGDPASDSTERGGSKRDETTNPWAWSDDRGRDDDRGGRGKGKIAAARGKAVSMTISTTRFPSEARGMTG